MKILYLTLLDVFKNDLYNSLIEELELKGHEVTVVMPSEKKNHFEDLGKRKVLEVKVKDLYSKNMILKAKANILVEKEYKKAIKKFLFEKYDVVVYTTPPITFSGVVKYCKKKYDCKSYLMLKDIFPQNAVDIEMFSKRSIPYKLFKRKEKQLYEVSDFIGCMSEENRKYLLENEVGIDKNKVEIFPNTLKIKSLKKENLRDLREYNIENNDLVFIFGGNLGKPQGIDFLLKGIEAVKGNKNIKFIIVGNGTEVEKVRNMVRECENLVFIDRLEKEKYDELVRQCDVGIISLDYRFTIPNYPSRTLSYMENAMPIFACTDKITDIKELVEDEAKCGKWCYSNSIEDFKNTIDWFVNNKKGLSEFGMNGRRYLEKNFNVEKSVDILEKHFCK